MQAEGCYSGGRVTVCALPAELLGPNNLHTWPLRRLEGTVSDAELADHVSREMGKVRMQAAAHDYGQAGSCRLAATASCTGSNPLLLRLPCSLTFGCVPLLVPFVCSSRKP